MTNTFQAIDIDDLDRVSGGQKLDWNAIKAEAQPHCPQTVAKYSRTDPSTVNRSLATRMGNECLAEMGPFKAGFARGRIRDAIDQAFPRQ